MMNSDKRKQREKIIRGARKAFMMKGFSSTSTTSLAEQLRMSKTTLYNHFPTKTELLEAVVDNIMEEIEEKCMYIMDQHELTAMDKIKRFMYLITEHLLTLDVEVISDIQIHAPHVYEKVVARKAAIIDKYVINLFNSAVEQGVFRDDLDQRIVVDVMIQALRVLGSPQYLKNSPHTFEMVFQQIFSLVIEGNLRRNGSQWVGH
ncbi:hypothetical protein CEN49_17705 [Fischerella thermalis CCMEE 5273]|nr:hypothetical protein CEN49_17705 [Fischerella thermalis CCMEE 5273]